MYRSRISQLCKEDVLSSFHDLPRDFHRAAHCSLPEWKIEYMVQAKGDQCSFDNTEDQGSQISCSRDQASQGINSVLHHRPDEVHQNTHAYICDG